MKYIRLSLLFILFSTTLFAQRSRFVNISGEVRYIFDSTIFSHTSVQLLEGGRVIIETLTDNEGKFNISAEKDKIFTIRITGLDELVYDTTINSGKDITEGLVLYIGRIIPDNRLKYNAFKAEADIAQGNVHLLTAGIPFVPEDYMKKITKKYGFTYKNIGQYTSNSIYQGIKKYNARVYRYLEERNGKGWQEEFEEYKNKKLDKILSKPPKK